LTRSFPSFAAAKQGGATKGDLEIIAAAQIAEALAVTTCSNIIEVAPFFKRLAADDQGYLRAAREEEMSHYLLEKSITGKPSPFTTFYYPPKIFSDAQTTLNVVTLEEAFIAAYLVGVRNFALPDLCVTAARIIGIESNHRTLARVIARRAVFRPHCWHFVLLGMKSSLPRSRAASASETSGPEELRLTVRDARRRASRGCGLNSAASRTGWSSERWRTVRVETSAPRRA